MKRKIFSLFNFYGVVQIHWCRCSEMEIYQIYLVTARQRSWGNDNVFTGLCVPTVGWISLVLGPFQGVGGYVQGCWVCLCKWGGWVCLGDGCSPPPHTWDLGVGGYVQGSTHPPLPPPQSTWHLGYNGIRLASGRYASHWNGFLLSISLFFQ